MSEEQNTWSLEEQDVRLFLTTTSLDTSKFIDFVKSPRAGAVIYFGGTTRDNFDGKEVVRLSYEAHTKLALKSLLKIVNDMKAKYSNKSRDEFIHKVMIGHRLGEVPVMQDSIMIALSSTHRQEGWNAAMYILEEIKKRVEIWKNEVYQDGTSTWKANENSC